MEWILASIAVGSSGLVLLYYTAKRNGKLEQQLREKSALLNAQAQDFRTIEAQMARWDTWRESVQDRLKAINVATIPDSDLQRLYKDPVHVEVTDPYSTKLGEGKPSK